MSRIKGSIGKLGLSDWWISEFSKDEQNHIITKYGQDLIKGNPLTKYNSRAVFLADLSSWINTKKEYPTTLKLIRKAEQELDNNLTVGDLHFYFLHMIRFYYKNRDVDDNITIAREYCNKQISISKAAKAHFQNSGFFPTLPAHTGFEQLAILEEKLKNYLTVIDLCKQAKEEGWAGDWDKRIERCTKKMKAGK